MQDQLNQILEQYEQAFGSDDHTQSFRIFANQHQELTSRKNLAGHVTGSAVVLDLAGNTVLRVFHAKLKSWVWSAGGHVDDGEMPWETARRELIEETGIENAVRILTDQAVPVPIMMQVQAIPASMVKNEPAHWHYDMVYLFTVEKQPVIQADPKEIAEFHWLDIKGDFSDRLPESFADRLETYERAFNLSFKK